MFLTWLKYGKPSLSLTLNGVLAGLVGITAGCDLVSPLGAVVIGLVCGLVLVYAIEFIDHRLHIDDPVGASSVHGVCGILGTLMTGLLSTSNGALYGLAGDSSGLSCSGYFASTYGLPPADSLCSTASRNFMACVSTTASKRKDSTSTNTARVAITKM